MVNATRTEAGLGDREPVPLAADQVGGRHPHVGELQFGVATVVAIVVAKHLHVAFDDNAGGVPGHEDLALLAMPVGGRVGLAHHDENLRVGVHGTGDPPLAAIDDVIVAVTFDAGTDICRVGGGDIRLRHREG